MHPLYEQRCELIRMAFAPVKVEQIVIGPSDLTNDDLAQVYVADSDLKTALGDNGSVLRTAAMLAEVDIELLPMSEFKSGNDAG